MIIWKVALTSSFIQLLKPFPTKSWTEKAWTGRHCFVVSISKRIKNHFRT